MPGAAIRRGLKILGLQKQAEKAAALEADLVEANKEIERLKGNEVKRGKINKATYGGGHEAGLGPPPKAPLPKSARGSLEAAYKEWKT
jgi:hypothetical protein